MKQKIAGILALVLISGCATAENYKKIMNTWVGSHVDRLVSSWGPPASSYQLSDGGVVLEYSNARNVQVGGYTYTEPQTKEYSGSATVYGTRGRRVDGTFSGQETTYVQKQTPVYNINKWCTTRVSANSRGVITQLSWEGNDCTALPPD